MAARDPDRQRAAVRRRCGELEGAVAEYPWGPEDEVYKVGGKAFAFVGLTATPARISLKCDPARIPGLRAVYPSVTVPSYLSKTHWNAITLDGGVPLDEVLALVDHSYDLIVASLPRRLRESLAK